MLDFVLLMLEQKILAWSRAPATRILEQMGLRSHQTEMKMCQQLGGSPAVPMLVQERLHPHQSHEETCHYVVGAEEIMREILEHATRRSRKSSMANLALKPSAVQGVAPILKMLRSKDHHWGAR